MACERTRQRMRWLDRVTDSMNIWETVKDREALHAAVHGVTKSQTQLSDLTYYERERERSKDSTMVWGISNRMELLRGEDFRRVVLGRNLGAQF